MKYTPPPNLKIPRWIKISRKFAFFPKVIVGRKIVWLKYVWEVEDSAPEEFLGLTPEVRYYTTELNALKSVSPYI